MASLNREDPSILDSGNYWRTTNGRLLLADRLFRGQLRRGRARESRDGCDAALLTFAFLCLNALCRRAFR